LTAGVDSVEKVAIVHKIAKHREEVPMSLLVNLFFVILLYFVIPAVILFTSGSLLYLMIRWFVKKNPLGLE